MSVIMAVKVEGDWTEKGPLSSRLMLKNLQRLAPPSCSLPSAPQRNRSDVRIQKAKSENRVNEVVAKDAIRRRGGEE